MHVGFYGKLPSHGDFLRRRVSDAFVDSWDAWLRDCLTASWTALGARWLDVYLTSPAWRFVCAAGVCGPAPLAGLLAPSVDQVGRYFPLTLVSELPEGVNLLAAASGSARFFEEAERLVIETLAAEQVDFERFDEGVMALEEELGPFDPQPDLALDPAAVALLTDVPQSWQLPIGGSSELSTAFEQVLSLHLEAKFRPLMLWWTDGSAIVEPSCLVGRGLPQPAQYSAFLEGAWADHRWRPLPGRRGAGDATLPTTLITELESLSYRSAAATDIGRARGNNEDAFLERSDMGLWVVADGMGGHSHGEVASRMVCDGFVDFQPDGTFEEAVVAATVRLQQINDHLYNSATGSHPAGRMGSTVVVLMVRGVRSAVLWAGDSRVYRLRAGQLDQLSRDHSLAAATGQVLPVQSSVITRAVGVQPDLTLDVYRDIVRPADRFLLCSDGLTRVVADKDIAALMATDQVDAAVRAIIEATLAAGAPDNVTALIVEAYK
jgi:type VI secretion system protein ImpM